MPDVKEQVNQVARVFKERGLIYEHINEREKPMIRLVFGGGDWSFTHVVITVIFDEDGASAQIVTSPIASVPAEKMSQLLFALNECNHRFRWVKFYLDGDNDIIADADTVFDGLNAGDACHELVMRTASIIDEAYPTIMKEIWG